MRRGLQLALATLGTAAATIGARDFLTGGEGVVEGGRVSANIDSELRFRAAWYVVFGVLLLRAARSPESETVIVRACAAGFLLAGCGRVLSMRALGPPSTVFKVLMALEFAIPAAIVPWQSAVRRSSERFGV
jgi:Domain of unknown function (DUF4345)